MINKIIEDKRSIKAIHIDSSQVSLFVNNNYLNGQSVQLESERSLKITKIIPYWEDGDVDAHGDQICITFYAVYVDWGDAIWQRIPANNCRVEYFLE